MLKASDNLTFVAAEKRSVERQLEQTKQRFAVGLTAITDVHEAQAQYDSVVAREISSENELENAREALREITGQYHAQVAQLNTDKFSTSRPTPAKAKH
ncbi:TolC family protein [Alishewanella longhuensis]